MSSRRSTVLLWYNGDRRYIKVGILMISFWKIQSKGNFFEPSNSIIYNLVIISQNLEISFTIFILWRSLLFYLFHSLHLMSGYIVVWSLVNLQHIRLGDHIMVFYKRRKKVFNGVYESQWYEIGLTLHSNEHWWHNRK